MLRRLRRRTEESDADGQPPGSAAELEREIVEALTRLRTTTAREVMTPRVDVVALEMPVKAEDVAREVKESGHSRFPVYEESLDQLVGVLFVKDLFRMGEPASPEAVQKRLRKPYLVPESRHVLELLQEMRQRRLAFAVVVDEYGGVEGVLTIKDLVSELVGDLRDEFDRLDDAEVIRIDAERWLLDAQMGIDDAREQLGVDLPDGDYVTLAGFLYSCFGRIPDESDVCEHEGWEFRIQEMDRRRIAKVIAKAPSGAPVPSSSIEVSGK
ncbi:MAG: hemolysin family protein [Acidimicrobiales bacterium]